MEETGKVDALAFGGEGIIRHKGLVTFVPFTAPGDEILFSIRKAKKSFATGKLQQVLSPSSERNEPPCPYFGKCGGCQLQHIKYKDQLKHKRQWVYDALQRIGGFENPIVEVVHPTEEQYQYRRRITLTMLPRESGYQIGYHAYEGAQLVSIDACALFDESPILQQIGETISLLKPSDNMEGKIALIKSENKHIMVIHLKSMPPNARQIVKEAFERFPNWQGVSIQTQKEHLDFGDIQPFDFCIEGIRVSFSPLAFVQNHPWQSEKIYRQICQIARQVGAKKVLDLYCGIGISALMLSRECEVIGVEWNKAAVHTAESNKRHNGLSRAQFIQGDVNKRAPLLLAQQKPDLVIVNPPRTGLEKVLIEELVRSLCKHVIYISICQLR